MEDPTYAAEVARVFKQIIKACDKADPDVIEADATHDMVTLTAIKTGEKIVINTQRAVKQIWVAGSGIGVHFSLSADGLWRDDKDKGLELLSWVSQCVSTATGLRLPL